MTREFSAPQLAVTLPVTYIVQMAAGVEVQVVIERSPRPDAAAHVVIRVGGGDLLDTRVIDIPRSPGDIERANDETTCDKRIEEMSVKILDALGLSYLWDNRYD